MEAAASRRAEVASPQATPADTADLYVELRIGRSLASAGARAYATTRPDAASIAIAGAVEKFNFHGDMLDVVPGDGQAHVVIRRVCEALGIAFEAQLRKLRDDPAMGVIMMIIPTDGGTQQAACIDVRSLPLWLATIHPSKVRPEVRDKLIRYKRECAEVLADHFLGKRGRSVAVAPAVTTEQMVAAMRPTIAGGGHGGNCYGCCLRHLTS